MRNANYVFNDAESAMAAESFITVAGGQVRVGHNAATGEPEPMKEQTSRWAIPRQRLDGKWVFPVVPQSLIDSMPDGVAQEFAQKHAANFSIELMQSDWFAEPSVENEK